MTRQPDKRHVVVIGAGFGGVACARKLARDPNIVVTLVDRHNHHLFQPLLYQVATSTLTAPLIARSVRGLFSKWPRVHVRYDRAEELDLTAKTVRFSSGECVDYDSLVIAVGARTSYFGNDHWASHVIPLKTLSDAFRIRQRVLRNLEVAERCHDDSERRRLTTVAIVGGGPTGVELAGAFSDLIRRSMRRGFKHIDTANQRIVLLEGLDRLLSTYSESHSEYTRHQLEQLGVEVRTGTMVSDITESKVHLSDGDTIEADTILWTAGVQAAELVQNLDVEHTRSGQVVVEPDLSVPGYPDAFVIGDAASIRQKDGSLVPGVAPAAMQCGSHVARLILNHTKPRKPFRYRDKGSMAIIGKGSGVVDLHGWRIQGRLGWFMWLFVHVVFLVDFRSRLGVLMEWFWAYVHDKPGSRVFTAPSDSSEKKEDTPAPEETQQSKHVRHTETTKT